MANLTNINVMSASQFDSLDSISDTELYYINVLTDSSFKSIISAAGVPDYNSGVALANSNSYTFTTNGYLYLRLFKSGSGSTSGTYTIDGHSFTIAGNDYNEDNMYIPIKANTTFSLAISFITTAMFFPCSGEV